MVKMKKIVIALEMLLFLTFPLIPALADQKGDEKRGTAPGENLTILYSANTRGTLKPYG